MSMQCVSTLLLLVVKIQMKNKKTKSLIQIKLLKTIVNYKYNFFL